MADFQNLQDAVTDLLAQVDATKGVQQSAVTLINGFAELVTAKVTEALTADNAADDKSIAAATAAIAGAKAEMLTSTTSLGDAVAANS